MTNEILIRAKKKALSSYCRYRISAVGFNYRGDAICVYSNSPRFAKFHGGLHAEMAVVKNYPSVKTILLCRVGAKGNLLPIHPCRSCAKVLEKLNIRVIVAK